MNKQTRSKKKQQINKQARKHKKEQLTNKQSNSTQTNNKRTKKQTTGSQEKNKPTNHQINNEYNYHTFTFTVKNYSLVSSSGTVRGTEEDRRVRFSPGRYDLYTPVMYL